MRLSILIWFRRWDPERGWLDDYTSSIAYTIQGAKISIAKRAQRGYYIWMPGNELAAHAELARLADLKWEGQTVHGVREKFYMLPKRAFRDGKAGEGLVSLAHYLKWLAGLEKSPDMWALENFMADGGIIER